jgi:hypothetical protein
MYITTIANRNSPPAVLLRESYREQNQVKSPRLANLGCDNEFRPTCADEFWPTLSKRRARPASVIFPFFR